MTASDVLPEATPEPVPDRTKVRRIRVRDYLLAGAGRSAPIPDPTDPDPADPDPADPDPTDPDPTDPDPADPDPADPDPTDPDPTDPDPTDPDPADPDPADPADPDPNPTDPDPKRKRKGLPSLKRSRQHAPDPEPAAPADEIRAAAGEVADVLLADPDQRRRVANVLYNGAAAALAHAVGVLPWMRDSLDYYGRHSTENGAVVGVGVIAVCLIAEIRSNRWRGSGAAVALRLFGWIARVPLAAAALALALYSPNTPDLQGHAMSTTLAAASGSATFLGGLGTGGLALVLTVALILGTRKKGGETTFPKGLALTLGLAAGTVWMGAGIVWGMPDDMVTTALQAVGVGKVDGPLGNVQMRAIALVLVVVAYLVKLKPRAAGVTGIIMASVFSAAGGAWTIIATTVGEFFLGLAA
ncbi:hypothetical protein [Streptomyces sp. NPDC008125]|uniref:hypothetical protein n=1 Tax=Streptomyces sp. NPDC008125 TaxID=3364811 RepID=UPI0036E2E9C0